MNQKLLHGLRRLAGAGLLGLAGLSAQAQTTTTVFSEDFEGATNSFTLENGSQNNQWVVAANGGNGPTSPGSRAAYISNDFGATNAYNITSASVVHLYRDVVLPAGQGAIQLNFDWRGVGDVSSDYLLVQVAPTSFTPVAGTVPAAASATALAQLNQQSTFARASLVLPASLAGTTQRLIFTWVNNAFTGTQPPALVDNITVTTRAATPLSGAYTINSALPTAGTNFASFTEAATRLNLDGIGGPVTLAVTGGPYTEQFSLGQVPGTSATNTIVVNGGGSIIRFASTTNQRAVVQLNGTDYTTITNLVIDATGGTTGVATSGIGVLLTNAADNDQLTNNTITVDGASTSTNFAGIAVSGSTLSATATGNSANNLLVQGNTITGGYYGIALYGSSATAQNTGNILRNNTIRDFYSYGIYAGFQLGAQLVGNDIARPLRTNTTTFNGIYIAGQCNGLAIEKNRIHDPFTGSPSVSGTSYGIYLAGNGSTSTTTNDIVNNVVYKMTGSSGQYLIYSGTGYSRIYNNTLSSDEPSATSANTTYGIFTSGINADIRNNVVSITRPGTGGKFGVYISGNPAVTALNYNDFYVPNGNVGYLNANYATLASWQTATGYDQNSLAVNPIFASAGTGNLQPADAGLNNSGTPLARVTDDITGAPRGAAPDMGAYEFSPIALDVLPAGLASPATTSACYGTAETVSALLRNSGSATLNFATNPATVTVVVTPPTGATQTFTTSLTTGTLASGTTQAVALPGTLNMSAAGTYSFAITATVVGDGNTANDVLTPAPTRTVLAPVAGTLVSSVSDLCGGGNAGLTLTGAANGSLQLQSSTSATGTFTDVAGATSANYVTPTLTSTTYYRVRVGCNASVVYSNVVGIVVNSPQLTATNSPLSICAGATATLTATAGPGSTVRFFSAATGGTALATTTAGSYTTPALAASTTYYAAAATGGAETVGPTAYNATGQTPATGGAVYFTATASFILTSVTVYLNAGQAAGTVTIDLRAGRIGATVNGLSNAFAVPAGPATGTAAYVIPLNYQIPAAGQYSLYIPSATQGGLLRDNSGTHLGYPITSPSGVLSLVGGNVVGYHNYFYNWQINNECVSATRTPIQVNVAPAPTATLSAATQANGAVLLTAAPVAGATYQFYLNGAAVGAASATNTLLLQSGTLNGSYTVVVTSAGCASAPSNAVAVTVTGTRPASLGGVSLLVYPNPTPDGRLTLELTGPQAKASQLEVLNALGQVVLSRTLAPGAAQLSLAGLAPGMYTLRAHTEQGVLTQRVVRE
ncbi:MAG TPA: T9SS type A sorting domain-containing protein [Hymenobacter sp.]|uniref:beta strand repeat-containing protein n=1 Tax=Hymenobacter sp. TaxID=1898978 RepID=UPI002D7E39C2|nr:T9SS type A sorting domain-containing protein [Hymenobacter sp.]HET9504039.1 T9SS type A sorting domain-containing protein [Hymenobacter sp.]